MAKGFEPWTPLATTQVFLDQVLDVIMSQQDEWPLTQRYWLYRLMAKHGWLKVDEYTRSKAPLSKRHLCTDGKNLNLILDRGRRAEIIPWEAVTGGRGQLNRSPSSDSPEDLADLIGHIVNHRQFDRQKGQERQVVLWMETEGLVPLVKSTAMHYGALVLAGKGFDTITNKHEFAELIALHGDVLILHAGDLDKSGHTLHVALIEDLQAFVIKMGGSVELRRIALTEEQVKSYALSSTPVTEGLNAGNHGDGFTSKVECQLEAMDAPDIRQVVSDALEDALDMDLLNARIDMEPAKRVAALEILIDENT